MGTSYISIAIQKFVEKSFRNEIPFDKYYFAETCSLVINDDSKNWWHKALDDSLRLIGQAENKTILKNIW